MKVDKKFTSFRYSYVLTHEKKDKMVSCGPGRTIPADKDSK